MADELPEVTVRTLAEWRAWLAAHHDSGAGVWLVTFKKASGQPHVPMSDVVDEALAFGWVDSRPRRLDADRSARLITPRKPGANWSRVNKEKVARLEREGRMTPAGRAVVAAAKKSGTWTALDAVEELAEPDDLRAALDADPDARRHWDAFPRSARRAILEWIAAAKRPETRTARVTDTATKAAQDVRANQWRQPRGRG